MIARNMSQQPTKLSTESRPNQTSASRLCFKQAVLTKVATECSRNKNSYLTQNALFDTDTEIFRLISQLRFKNGHPQLLPDLKIVIKAQVRLGICQKVYRVGM
jgi:hypothetical protein